MWFEELTGFAEDSPEQVKKQLLVKDGVLRSKVNGKYYTCGTLDIPSLAELRERVQEIDQEPKRNTVQEVVANVQHLHTEKRFSRRIGRSQKIFNALAYLS